MKEIILSVGEIKKSNSSYGNYMFEVIIKYPNSFKTNKSIFEYGLKNIKQKRREYLKEGKK